MLLTMCKTCQYCLETMYWNCCEEKFCFDKKIATYKLEDDQSYFGSNGTATAYSNGVTNMGASLESVVTSQPGNNNHLPPDAITGRETTELPVHADKLYEVFSRSMIFRDDQELKSKGSVDSLDDIETKSEPDYLSDRPNRTKVYFEDEVNSPVTDFEIMFVDELLGSHDMFQIDEEEESDKNSPDTEEGLTMNIVSVRKRDVIKPSTVTMKDETKMTTQNPIYEYDPRWTNVTTPSSLTLPKNENVKGILRQRNDLSRSASPKTPDRLENVRVTRNSGKDLKPVDPGKINKVLSRMPLRSASFLNIPEHLVPEKPQLIKSKSTIGVSLIEDSPLSKLPDTPIIKSNNLPRFFADSPTVPEYKEETSLQSIKMKTEMIYQANDFSMPRYYGTIPKSLEVVPVHESKSMPDLRNPSSTGKVSKRLVKIRGRLKPLIIKRDSSDKLSDKARN